VSGRSSTRMNASQIATIADAIARALTTILAAEHL
jgi:hypothetical protein